MRWTIRYKKLILQKSCFSSYYGHFNNGNGDHHFLWIFDMRKFHSLGLCFSMHNFVTGNFLVVFCTSALLLIGITNPHCTSYTVYFFGILTIPKYAAQVHILMKWWFAYVFLQEVSFKVKTFDPIQYLTVFKHRE